MAYFVSLIYLYQVCAMKDFLLSVCFFIHFIGFSVDCLENLQILIEFRIGFGRGLTSSSVKWIFDTFRFLSVEKK